MLSRLLRQLFAARRSGPDPGALEQERWIAGADEALRNERHEEAARLYLRAARSGTRSAELHCNLATALKTLGATSEALAHYRVAVELKPELSAAWYNLGLLYAEACELDTAEACYREALARNPNFREAGSSLLCLTSFHEQYGPERVLAEHREWAARHFPACAARAGYSNSRLPERRIRVGYVSADFREHAMAYFIEPILAARDAAAVDAILYSNSRREDATTRRLRGYAGEWRAIQGLADADAAARITQDGIDILVDLSGHTEGNRLGVFALKPAPVQATCLGYPNTTGLATMDYRFTDARADPPGSERFYCERLLRMPDSLWCYRPPAALPEVAEPPARTNGHVTFGSFNNVMKLSDSAIETWASLLRKLPDARLLVAAAGGEIAQNRLRSRFAAHGVELGRIDCMGRLPAADFRRLYSQVDVALDAFPCNGGTTTCETLWMGVPVVTLAGSTFPSRAGSSILFTVGLGKLVAASAVHYIEIATALASDLGGTARLRRGMRDRLAASPLMDATRYVRAFEAHCREAWRSWCESA